MSDTPVRKIEPGVSGGPDIKGIKRFGQDREDFENKRDAERTRLEMIEKTFRQIGTYKAGGKVTPKASILPKHATNPYAYATGGKVIKSSKF